MIIVGKASRTLSPADGNVKATAAMKKEKEQMLNQSNPILLQISTIDALKELYFDMSRKDIEHI